MAILLTGGTGRTSLRTARLLQDAKIQFRLASRKGAAGAPPGMQATTFDWDDSSTYKNPFQHTFLNEESISVIYLIASKGADSITPMNAFIDSAVKEHGVKKFVLMASSAVGQDEFVLGKVWQHLVDIGVGYIVLRPSWFMENFSEGQHTSSIKNEGKIYSACRDGKIPFNSATDISNVAFHALTDEKTCNTDYLILGPELLTYDEIAAKLSHGLGREIKHVQVSREENIQRYTKSLGEPYAKLLSSLEVKAANGLEERSDDTVKRVTGKSPQSFDLWVQENKAAWE